jgi:predicted phage-related endonuclease
MKQVHDLQQGSDAWIRFRADHFGASEAAAMLGLSKKTTRTELLRLKSSGVSKEFSDWVQKNILDHGHEVEALCRPIIEAFIGEQLSPVTLSDGKLSWSGDGLNFDDTIAWEHKQYSAALFAAVSRGELPEEHIPQCQQGLMISGAGRLIFTCSDGTPEHEASMDVFPDSAWFSRIRAGWAQFEKDLANYQHIEAAPEVIAAPTKDLPALSIQVNGSISLIDNLSVFGERLKSFVADIDMNPSDDQGFANAEAAVKTLQNAQDALEAAEASALAQTSSIDEMRKTVKLYADTARTTRLMLEKMVKARKESIRVEIAMTAKTELAAHIDTLNKRLIKVQLPPFNSDFAGVMKGKKTIASLREAVNNELVRVKLESNALADKIEINLNTLRELAKDHAFLFNDFAQLVLKANDDFIVLIKMRIAEHKQAEAAKMEAQRAAIQAQEEAKAKAAQEAILAAERAKMEAEVRAKAADEAMIRNEADAKLRDQEAIAKAAEFMPTVPTMDEDRAASMAPREADSTADVEERRHQAQLAAQAKPFKSGALPVAVEMISISKAEYRQLTDDALLLSCLCAAGVDNWEGWGDAISHWRQHEPSIP